MVEVTNIPRGSARASPALVKCGWGLERNRNGGNAASAKACQKGKWQTLYRMDTGAGFERWLMLLQDVRTVIDTDIMRPLLDSAQSITGTSRATRGVFPIRSGWGKG